MAKYEFSVFLRPFKDDDYILINKWRNDKELQKYTVGPFQYVSLEMEKEWVHGKMMSNRTEKYWAICPMNNKDKMIGYTSLNDIDHFNKKAYWGGIIIGDKDFQDGHCIFEVASIIHEYSFNELGLNRLYADYFIDHPFSGLMLTALGWTKEGLKRQAVYKHGNYKDLCYSSILRSEYLAMRKNNDFSVKSIKSRFMNCLKKSKKQK